MRNRLTSRQRIGLTGGLCLVVAASLLSVLISRPARQELQASESLAAPGGAQAELAPPASDAPLTVVNSLRGARADGQAADFKVEPLEGSAETRLELALPDLVLEAVPEGFAVRMPGESRHFQKGVPDLPVISRVVEGRPGLRPRVELVHGSFRDIPAMDVAPMPWNTLVAGMDGSEESDTVREEDPAIFGADAFWPADLVKVEEARQRGKSLVRLAFHPVQYQPRTGTLRYYEHMSARLTFEPATQESAITVESASVPAPPPSSDPCDCPDWGWQTVVPASPSGVASEFAVRRAGASVDAIYKFTIATNGLYRILGSTLTAAGVPPASLVGSQIRVFCRDREVAVTTSTEGVMGPSDWILLYAEGLQGLYTDKNAYWIGFGGTGLRMQNVSAAAVPGGTVVTSHCRTVSFDTNAFFSAVVLPLAEQLDHWYARQLVSLQSGPVDQLSTNLATDFPITGQTARVCARLVGVTTSNHLTRIRFNGTGGADFQWYQDPFAERKGSLYTGTATFASGTITHPSTTLSALQVVVGAQAADQVNVEEIRLVYPRRLKVASDRLSFVGQAGPCNYRVSNLSATSDIWALDVTDPYAPRRLTGFAVSNTPADGVQAEIGLNAADRPAIYVCRTQTVQQVASVQKTMFRGLGATDQQADWIVITPYEFRDSVYSLTTNRYVTGHSVAVAPLQDIYNEFSYGVTDADAIRQFIGYAYHHWQGPPPFAVLLAGRSTYDPRDYLNAAVKSVIPTHFGGTTETYTGLDTWFGLVDGADNLADVAVGRAIASSAADMQTVVNKTIAFQRVLASDPVRRRGTLVTGKPKNIGDNFNASADALAARLTTDGFTTVQKLYDCNCNVNIRSAIDAGRFLVAYLGHGAANLWDKTTANPSQFLWQSTDVPLLSNSLYPIVAVFTCQNGYSISPTATSLAQSFLQTDAKGSVALVAPAGLSQAIASDWMGEGFFKAMVTDDVRHLSHAIFEAQLSLFSAFGNSPTELLMYQIFGDPGLIVNPQSAYP